MTTKLERAAYLQAAVDGFNGVEYNAARHGMLTSSLHAAYCIGCWMKETGRTEPRDIRPSRGDRFNINGMLVFLQWRHVRFPVIERVA